LADSAFNAFLAVFTASGNGNGIRRHGSWHEYRVGGSRKSFLRRLCESDNNTEAQKKQSATPHYFVRLSGVTMRL